MAENLVFGCEQDHEFYVFDFEEAQENSSKCSTGREEQKQEEQRPIEEASESNFVASRAGTSGNNNYRFPKRNRILSNESQTFLDRFRSQASSKSLNFSPSRNSPSDSSASNSGSTTRTGRSFSVNNRNSSSSNSSSEFNPSGHPKPRKWYSFTSLLSRQRLVNILAYPRSRLSVSSTLNSVFIGTSSPPGESPTPNEEYHSGIFFSENYRNGGNNQDTDEICSSPTPSCVTISGEFPSRNSAYVDPSVDFFHGQNEHHYLKERNDNNGVCSSASEHPDGDRNGTYFCKNNTTAATTTRSSTSPLPETLRGPSFKRLPSSSASSRTSSRLSCGEFFSAVAPSQHPSAVIRSTGCTADLSAAACQRNRKERGANVRKALGRSLPTLLRKWKELFMTLFVDIIL